jgi:hypothetical protein
MSAEFNLSRSRKELVNSRISEAKAGTGLRPEDVPRRSSSLTGLPLLKGNGKAVDAG